MIVASCEDFILGIARDMGSRAVPENQLVTVSSDIEQTHWVAWGRSGGGKSVFNERWFCYLVRNGINAIVLAFRTGQDDYFMRMLMVQGIPPEQVTYVDFSSSYLVGLNALGFGPGPLHSRVRVVFDALKAESESSGVRWEADLRGSLTALAEVQGSLLDLAKVVIPDPSFRRELISRVTDEYALDFLTSFDSLSPEAQRVRADAVVNKIDRYLSIPALRKALGASSAINVDECLNSAPHYTVIGLATEQFPGSTLAAKMIVGAILAQALRRGSQPRSERRPVWLFIDEFQSVILPDYKVILSECRKYGLHLVLSSQVSSLIERDLRASISTNCSLRIQFAADRQECAEFAGEVDCGLTRDEVTKRIMGLPVGSAVALRRGEAPAAVAMDNSEKPEVDEAAFQEFRERCLARTCFRPSDNAAASNKQQPTLQEVQDAKEPIRRKKK